MAEAVIITHPREQHERERERDRTRDLIRGYNFQIGDWVGILNPKDEQPVEGEIIGKTRDDLYKIKGSVRINGEEVDKIIRRGPRNIEIIGAILY